MTPSANARQLYALGFAAFTVPAILLLPRMGWLWATVAAVLGAALLALLIFLRRRCRKPLVQTAAAVPFGKAALIAVLIWNLLMLGVFSAHLCQAYPSGSSFPLVGLLLLLLAVYAAQKGSAAVIRTGAIVFFFLVGFYILILGFSLPNIRLSWLRPVWKVRWQELPAVLAPISVLYFCEGETGKPALWLIGGVLLAALAALVTAGSLSAPVAARETFPFYTAAKSVELFGTMERLEPLVSAALTAGGFCLLGTLCAVNGEILAVFFPKPKNFNALTNFLVGGSCMWLSGVTSEVVISVGTTIFWGIFPLLTLLVGGRKKT